MTARQFRFFFCLVGVVLLLAGPRGAHAAVTLDAPDAVRPLIAPVVEAFSAELDRADALERLAAMRRVRHALADALAAEGWFSAQTEVTLDPAPRVVVRPGARAVVSAVSIQFVGAIERDAARQAALRHAWMLPIGAPLRATDWETAKSRLLQAVGSEDFAAATLADSRAEVDPAAATARLSVTLDSGPYFTLGALRVVGLSEYPPALVARYNRIAIGAPYSQARLLELQSALQNTPYFSSVIVDVQRDATAPREVPVDVQVTEARTQHVGLGLGASTNYGPRVQASYRHNNLFDRAWGLDVGVRADNLRGSGYADVLLPVRADGAKDSVGVLREHTDIQGLATHRVAFGANRDQVRGALETRWSVNWQQESRTPEGLMTVTRNALSVNGSWTWRDVDNPLDPQRGWLINLQAGGGTRVLLSDQNFVRGYARGQYFHPITPDNILSLRGELGTTVALEREGVPQEFLFRAGGAQSVRGYAYQSLGIREGSATVGGRFMSVLSGELTHWWSPKWGIAGFVDAGNVSDSRDSFRYLYGVGLGARWRSPAGPLAFDLAYGERDRNVRPHFSIMIAF